jgi:pimeloyl-ACP methyl ester carboxylesterase
MEPSVQRVPGVEQIDLNLLRWSGGGVALLFLHGFDNDSHVWDAFAPAVAPYYQTLALDHRGHGDSAWDPECRYDPQTMAQDVEAVLAHLGIQRVVLVGHSLGGRVAMRFAGRNSEKLAGLVLVDVGPELDARGVTRIQLEMQTVEPSFRSVAEFEDVLAQRYPVTDRGTLARLARHWLRQRPDGRYETKTDPAFGQLHRELSAEETQRRARQDKELLWDALKKVPCPTLVVRGAASDILDPETADRMAEEVLPDGKLETIARAGHSVMLDNPEAFLTSLSGFVLGED